MKLSYFQTLLLLVFLISFDLPNVPRRPGRKKLELKQHTTLCFVFQIIHLVFTLLKPNPRLTFSFFSFFSPQPWRPLLAPLVNLLQQQFKDLPR